MNSQGFAGTKTVERTGSVGIVGAEQVGSARMTGGAFTLLSSAGRSFVLT